MSMTSELSASDVALLSGRNSNQNGDGMFGGNGAWWIIILFLFVFCGWGNNSWGGFGNRNGGQGSVMDGYVLTSDFANIERKIDNVNSGLCDGFYAQAQLTNGVQMQMANGFARRKTPDKNPLHECNMEGIFDPRFDYFARRKEGQNCESGDFVFRMIVLQSSIINGLQRVQKCSHKNINSFLRRIKKSAIS